MDLEPTQEVAVMTDTAETTIDEAAAKAFGERMVECSMTPV